eukprot:10416144-Alexandrium_andersonii.AAC.1
MRPNINTTTWAVQPSPATAGSSSTLRHHPKTQAPKNHLGRHVNRGQARWYSVTRAPSTDRSG